MCQAHFIAIPSTRLGLATQMKKLKQSYKKRKRKWTGIRWQMTSMCKSEQSHKYRNKLSRCFDAGSVFEKLWVMDLHELWPRSTYSAAPEDMSSLL